MTGPKRSDFEREDNYRCIADLYLQGKTQAEIAVSVNLDQSQVSRDLAVIQRRWRENTAINMDEAKQKELSRIDTLERTYWEAWKSSAGEHTKTRTEHFVLKGDEDAEDSEKQTIVGKVITDIEMLLGVPAFLAGVMSCIERRCKILGLDAPTKIAPTTPDGKEPYENVADVLTGRINLLAARINQASNASGDSKN